jgi:hypothetical protein
MPLTQKQVDALHDLMSSWAKQCIDAGVFPAVLVAMEHGKIGAVDAMLCVGKSFTGRDLRNTLINAALNIADDDNESYGPGGDIADKRTDI